MDIWSGITYLTRGGSRRLVLDVFVDRYGVKTVKWESADEPVPHGGNGRRAVSGFMPLSVFERAVLEEVPR